MIKNFNDYINEQNNNQSTKFDVLELNQIIRLFNRGEDIGVFKIEQLYTSNPNTIKGFDTVLVQKLNPDGSFDTSKGLFTINIEDQDYTFQILEKKEVVGILFVYREELLLVRETGKSNSKGFTYPKGSAKPNEKREDTATRELNEETGIDYPSELLKGKKLYSFQYFKPDEHKIQYFYIVNLTKQEYNRYINTKIIPKENLQLDEIDWAGFIPIEDCKDLLKENFEKILDYI